MTALRLRGIGRDHSHKSSEEFLSERNGKITGLMIIKLKKVVLPFGVFDIFLRIVLKCQSYLF